MTTFAVTVSPVVNAITVATSSPTVEINGTVTTATGAAGGDLAGNYPNPTVDGLQGRALASTAPTNGQALVWNNSLSQWEPGTVAGGSGTVTQVSSGTGLTGGPITTSGTLSVDFAASGSATAGKAVEATDSRLSDARSPSGSAGGSLSGTYPNPGIANNAVGTNQIADDAVTLAKIADMANARLLGNSSGVSSSPTAIAVSSPLGFNGVTGNLEFTAPGTNGQVYYRSGGALTTTSKFAFSDASSTLTLVDPTSTAFAAYSWDNMTLPSGFFMQASFGQTYWGDYLGIGNGSYIAVDDSNETIGIYSTSFTFNGKNVATEDDLVALAVAL